jgi:hypothetical protein
MPGQFCDATEDRVETLLLIVAADKGVPTRLTTHSITLSARASNDAGMSLPSAAAAE